MSGDDTQAEVLRGADDAAAVPLDPGTPASARSSAGRLRPTSTSHGSRWSRSCGPWARVSGDAVIWNRARADRPPAELAGDVLSRLGKALALASP
jgi:hypothetical protein